MENINDTKEVYTEAKSEKNINKIIEQKTNKLIETFSGKDLKISTKIVDNTIAFIGAAGGTGTSTLVANVAYTMTKKGLRVLVVDMNLMYPIQQALLGVKQDVHKKDLVSFVLGNNQLGDSIDNKGNLAVLCSNNRYIMDHINCDTEAASKNLIDAVKRVKHLFDMIIFDCPRQIEFDLVNSVLYNCNLIYTVWDENIECISNIDRMRKNMLACGIESYAKIKAIFNKKTSIFYTNSVFKELEIDVVETLPFDIAVIESGLKGEVFCEKGASMSQNAAEFTRKIQSLTDSILKIGGYGSNGQ